MKVFQLGAKGPRRYFDGVGQIMSSKLYRTRERATEAIEEFKKNCSDAGNDARSLNDLDPDHIKVSILELELEDE